MDVSWSPGVRMVHPGIRPRTNRQEPIDAVLIRQTATHAKKVRIERPRPLIPFVEVTTRCIGLPDLQECIRHRNPTVVKHTTGHDNALTDGLTSGPSVPCEISIFRGDSTDGRAGSR